MTIFLTAIHFIVCITLIVVILLQAGRGHGLAGSSMGGGMTQSFFGTKTATFMSKATSVCAIVFIINCLTIDIVNSKRQRSLLSNTTATTLPLTQEDIQKQLSESAKNAESVQEKAETAGTQSE